MVQELYSQMVEGRSYEALSESLAHASGFFLLFAVGMFFSIPIIWDELTDNMKKGYKPILRIGIPILMLASLACGLSSAYCHYVATTKPTPDDVKMLIVCKVGEEVVDSPQFKELVEGATKLISEK